MSAEAYTGTDIQTRPLRTPSPSLQKYMYMCVNIYCIYKERHFACHPCHWFVLFPGQGGYGYLKEWMWWAGMILSELKNPPQPASTTPKQKCTFSMFSFVRDLDNLCDMITTKIDDYTQQRQLDGDFVVLMLRYSIFYTSIYGLLLVLSAGVRKKKHKLFSLLIHACVVRHCVFA